MAPEQVIGHQHEVDARSDLYSLTAVLYELLCLHYYLGPVGGKIGDLVAAILQRRPVDAEDFKHPQNGRVPRILSRICRKGLEKRPAARFQTAADLELALQAWLEGESPVVCPGTAIKRGLTRWSTLIDDYPVLVPAASITAIIVLLGWIVASVWFLARGA
jgi:serine/threonine protein kinase